MQRIYAVNHKTVVETMIKKATTKMYIPKLLTIYILIYLDYKAGGVEYYYNTLAFQHAQPEMCHSPKVGEEVKNNFFHFLDQFLWTIFIEEL